MRQFILFVLLTVVALPCCPAKPAAMTQVTVAQLEQTLAAAGAAHQSDAAITRQIRGMELSERLTEATLARLSADLKASSKAALALHLLADQSAFLEPPAGELPATPAPGDAAQKQMLAAVRNYVAQTALHLPNFLAIRTDDRFDNSHTSVDNDVALRQVGTSSFEISTRNDRENPATDQMTSWGQLGAILGMILLDSAHGTVTWSHWEEIAAGPAAAFHYSVPRSASHFTVIPPAGAPATTGPGGVLEGFGHTEAELPTYSSSAYATGAPVRPGYSGTLWLDPSTGTVLRITIEADSSDIAPYQSAAMMVQYGPVKIGDSTFTCPVRSLTMLSLSPGGKPAIPNEQNCFVGLMVGGRAPDCGSNAASGEVPPTQWLNETRFTGYHRFASTTRILSDAEVPH